MQSPFDIFILTQLKKINTENIVTVNKANRHDMIILLHRNDIFVSTVTRLVLYSHTFWLDNISVATTVSDFGRVAA